MSWLERLVQRRTEPAQPRASYAPKRRDVVDPADPEVAGRAEKTADEGAPAHGEHDDPAIAPARSPRDAAAELAPSRARTEQHSTQPRAGVDPQTRAQPRGAALEPVHGAEPHTAAAPAIAPAPIARAGDRAAVMRQRARDGEARAEGKPMSELDPPQSAVIGAAAVLNAEAKSAAVPLDPPRPPTDALAPAAAPPSLPPAVDTERAAPQALVPSAAPQPVRVREPAPQLSIGRVVIEVGAPAVKLVAPRAGKPRRAASAAPGRRAGASPLRFGLGVS